MTISIEGSSVYKAMEERVSNREYMVSNGTEHRNIGTVDRHNWNSINVPLADPISLRSRVLSTNKQQRYGELSHILYWTPRVYKVRSHVQYIVIEPSSLKSSHSTTRTPFTSSAYRIVKCLIYAMPFHYLLAPFGVLLISVLGIGSAAPLESSQSLVPTTTTLVLGGGVLGGSMIRSSEETLKALNYAHQFQHDLANMHLAVSKKGKVNEVDHEDSSLNSADSVEPAFCIRNLQLVVDSIICPISHRKLNGNGN